MAVHGAGTLSLITGIYFPLTALSYKDLVKAYPTKLEIPIVTIIGMKILISLEVSMMITANEYVILVYPAIKPEHPSIM